MFIFTKFYSARRFSSSFHQIVQYTTRSEPFLRKLTAQDAFMIVSLNFTHNKMFLGSLRQILRRLFAGLFAPNFTVYDFSGPFSPKAYCSTRRFSGSLSRNLLYKARSLSPSKKYTCYCTRRKYQFHTIVMQNTFFSL